MIIKKVSVSQGSPTMILKEGIVANNDILNYEEFKDFVKKEMLQQLNIEQIKTSLQSVLTKIEKKDVRGAYIEWEKFQKDIFNNKNYHVSLLWIANIADAEHDTSFQYATKEQDVLGESGKLSRLNQISQTLFQEMIKSQITDHLDEFLRNLETESIPERLRNDLFLLEDKALKSRASKAARLTKNWTYKNIFYGNNPSWRGNAADAFVNHMARLHVQAFSKDLSISNKNLFAVSVFQEERENLFKLLADSRNNIAWFTGGDVIIKYGGILYNIQVKTSQKYREDRDKIGGEISTQKLKTIIESLLKEIGNDDIDRVIEIFYSELKTSGWIEFANQGISKIAEDLTNQNFFDII